MEKIELSRATVKAKVIGITGGRNSYLTVLVKEFSYTEHNGKTGNVVFEDFSHKFVFCAQDTSQPWLTRSIWEGERLVSGDIIEFGVERYGSSGYFFTSFKVIASQKYSNGLNGLEALVREFSN